MCEREGGREILTTRLSERQRQRQRQRQKREAETGTETKAKQRQSRDTEKSRAERSCLSLTMEYVQFMPQFNAASRPSTSHAALGDAQREMKRELQALALELRGKADQSEMDALSSGAPINHSQPVALRLTPSLLSLSAFQPLTLSLSASRSQPFSLSLSLAASHS